jgi:hypothetical protein
VPRPLGFAETRRIAPQFLRFARMAMGQYAVADRKGGAMLGTLGMLIAKGGGSTDTILWVIAAVLVVAGIVALIRGSILVGVVLIVLGLLVGPGGVSIFN